MQGNFIEIKIHNSSENKLSKNNNIKNYKRIININLRNNLSRFKDTIKKLSNKLHFNFIIKYINL